MQLDTKAPLHPRKPKRSSLNTTPTAAKAASTIDTVWHSLTVAERDKFVADNLLQIWDHVEHVTAT